MSFHYHLRYRNGAWRTLSDAEYGAEIMQVIENWMKRSPRYLVTPDSIEEIG